MVEMLAFFAIIIGLLILAILRIRHNDRARGLQSAPKTERPSQFRVREGDPDAPARSRKVKLVYRDNPNRR